MKNKPVVNPEYKFMEMLPVLKKPIYKRLWFIVGSISLTLLIIFGFIGWMIISGRDITNIFSSNATRNESTISSSQASKLVQADVQANLGNVDAAAKAYDDVIVTTEDDTDKVLLLMAKASIYYNDYNYDMALSVAREAEAIDANYSVLSFIGMVYKDQYDFVNALSYFQRALVIMQGRSDSTHKDDSIAYLQSEIESVNQEIATDETQN